MAESTKNKCRTGKARGCEAGSCAARGPACDAPGPRCGGRPGGEATRRNAAKACEDQLKANAGYRLMAVAARREQLAFAARVFKETSKQELAHATIANEMRAGLLAEGGPCEKADVSHSTLENLQRSVEGEKEDEEQYRSFAEEARLSGDHAAAAVFEGLSQAERFHGARFRTMLAVMQSWRCPFGWKCLRCGSYSTAPMVPAACPGCGAPRGYFEPMGLNGAAVEKVRAEP